MWKAPVQLGRVRNKIKYLEAILARFWFAFLEKPFDFCFGLRDAFDFKFILQML